MDDQQLAERIKARLAALGRSPIEAANKGGLERSYIRDFLNEKKKSIKRKYYVKIAKGLDWTVEQLISTDTIKQDDEHRWNDRELPVVIPEIDVRAGGSYAGGFGQEEADTDAAGNTVSRDVVRAEWGIPAPFLRDELHVRPGRVHILPIRGDSMVDTLFDGDRAVIDLDDTDVSQGGIFALVDDNGSVIIKQIELLRGVGSGPRRIRCKSRNPNYEPFELLLDDPVRIVGRVACRITRL